MHVSLRCHTSAHSGGESSSATLMLLLPLLLFFPSLLGLLFATQNSALYRYPTGRASFGKFKCDPFYFLWEEKLTSSMVEDKLDCTFLCVGELKCYSFNIAVYPDSKVLHLCELLATDKDREAEKVHANANFHHCSPLVRSLHMFGDKHFSYFFKYKLNDSRNVYFVSSLHV